MEENVLILFELNIAEFWAKASLLEKIICGGCTISACAIALMLIVSVIVYKKRLKSKNVTEVVDVAENN